MNHWQAQLSVSEEDVLNFFYEGLRKTAPAQSLSQREALHVASVLAHYAQVSCVSREGMPAPTNLEQVFDNFILPLEAPNDVAILETAAAQCLFLLGFFPQHMGQRHSLVWYEQFGRAFYLRASYFSHGPEQRKTFWRMSHNFHEWTIACQEFRRQLEENRLLFRLQ